MQGQGKDSASKRSCLCQKTTAVTAHWQAAASPQLGTASPLPVCPSGYRLAAFRGVFPFSHPYTLFSILAPGILAHLLDRWWQSQLAHRLAVLLSSIIYVLCHLPSQPLSHALHVKHPNDQTCLRPFSEPPSAMLPASLHKAQIQGIWVTRLGPKAGDRQVASPPCASVSLYLIKDNNSVLNLVKSLNTSENSGWEVVSIMSCPW